MVISQCRGKFKIYLKSGKQSPKFDNMHEAMVWFEKNK